MITIGITGGIGSGKTTVLEEWHKLGAYVIRADQLAKRIMREDPELRRKIKELFGDHAYKSDGDLNREYLAREAFKKGRVDELNALVHPKVQQYTLKEIEHARKNHFKTFVKEAALLLQEGRPDYLDIIVLVKADRNRRIAWVVERDQVTAGDVEQRISRQQSDQEMESMVDYIIENNSSLQVLKQKAHELYQQLAE